MKKIEKVIWLSKESKEAEVYLSDGDFNITCFSHPFKYEQGNCIEDTLHTLNAKGFLREVGKEVFSVEKRTTSFGYCLTGKIISYGNELCVKVGAFVLELDNSLPSDMLINDYVSFECDRIDIW